MSEARRYKKRLSLKFTVGFLILGFFVIASGCVVGYVKYTDVIEKMYNDEAYHIAYTVRESLDGDWIEGAAADIRVATMMSFRRSADRYRRMENIRGSEVFWIWCVNRWARIISISRIRLTAGEK